MYGDWNWPEYNNYNDWFADWGWNAVPAPLQAFLAGIFVIIGLIILALAIMQIVGMWKTFKKAGQPGWAAIIPIYNIYTVIKITGLELWWVPVAVLSASYGGWGWWYHGILSLLAFGCLNYKIAQSFNKPFSFAIGMTIIPPIFWLILGTSKDIKYRGPAGPFKVEPAEAPKKAK